MNKSAHKVLMVDDEPNILEGFRRSLGRRYALVTANSGAAALSTIESEGPFAVVVTDMRMPQMDGVQFLEKAHVKCSESSYVMLTGNADQMTAIRAINQGRVFRFLNKPCQAEELTEAIDAAIRQYELITAERVLLRDTLAGSIRVLADALALSNPELGETMVAVRENITALCNGLEIELDWRYTTAASVCLLGYLVIGTAIDKAHLSEEALKDCADCAGRLLQSIPRIEQVVAMISRQREPGDLPDELRTNQIDVIVTIGSRLLRIAVDLERARHNLVRSDDILNALRAGPHGQRVVSICEGLLATRARLPGGGVPALRRETLEVSSLREGMTLEEDIRGPDQRLLLSKGSRCTEAVIERLRAFAKLCRIPTQVTVSWIAAEDGR